LRIGYGTVYQWGRKWDEQIEFPVNEGVVDIVEPDEIHSYLKEKKLQVDMNCC
jgi:hypothetical protein